MNFTLQDILRVADAEIFALRLIVAEFERREREGVKS